MWEDHENVLIGSFDVHIPKEPRLLMFDLDDTIISPKGRHRPGAPYKVWKFKKNVVEKLATVDGVLILISNQANLSKYKEDFKTKIEEVVDSLREASITLPILLYAANGYSSCRKPHTGIISQYLLPLLKEHKVGRIKELLYVGDAAGRKGDHSDSDRKFLMNIALYIRSKKVNSETPYFQEPEQYFENKKATPFVLSGINPKDIINKLKGGKKISELDSSIKYLKGQGQEVILMIGPPASGKTSIAKRIAKEWKYTRINQDTVGSKKKVDDLLEKSLNDGKSVVMDSTNGNPDRRSEQIDIAKEYFRENDLPIHIRAFVMNGDMPEEIQQELAHHMNLVRERSTNNPRIPKIAYRIYYKNYQPPSESEGFTQIRNVKFVPKFSNANDVLNFYQRT